jgi:hypothetical protein
VGTAEAAVIKLKTEAVGQDNYRVIEGVRALADARIPLVPQVVAGGGTPGNGSIVDVLMANLVQAGLAAKATSVPPPIVTAPPEIKPLR